MIYFGPGINAYRLHSRILHSNDEQSPVLDLGLHDKIMNNNNVNGPRQINANKARATRQPQVDRDVKAKTRVKQLKDEVRRAKSAALVNGKKKVKAADKSHRVTGGELGDYLKSLDYPFSALGVRCPVNYNPAPSYLSTTARTTCTLNNYSVPATTTATLVLLPGHSMITTGSNAMDPQAFHSNLMHFNSDPATTHRYFGPVNGTWSGGALLSCGGGIKQGAYASGQPLVYQMDANSTPLSFDVSLPYATDLSNGHVRSQLVSLGARFQQTTPLLTAGGTVVTAIPNQSNNFTTAAGFSLSALEAFPTYKDHGSCTGKGSSVTWIPRSEDLSYWHPVEVVESSGVSTKNVGIFIVFCNPTAAAISFDVEICYNWMLAGNLFNAITTPGPHIPAVKNIVEPAIAAGLASQSTVGFISKAADVVLAHDATKAGPSLGVKLASLAGAVVRSGFGE